MQRFGVTAGIVLVLGLWHATVHAHSMYQAAVLLDFHADSVDFELQLPAERLQAALNTKEAAAITAYILRDFYASAPSGLRLRIDSIDTPRLSTIEGAPYVVAHLRLAQPADLFDLNCSVLLDRVPSQVVLISIRTDWRTATFANDPKLVAALHGGNRSVRIDRHEGAWWQGFASVFKLGMRHIAEGADHLLFLLVLLFPAPLLVRDGRWTGQANPRRRLLRIGGIVTAFTAGHSVTLAAGALDLIHVPSRPIEVLIAVSILVSALHALRPLFPGREPVIAGCFGLVHGMAFATTLAELGLGRWDRVASILGFNLGIEAMQLIVVAIALPPLILLSSTRLYPSVRTVGALFSAVVALAWIAQRLWDLPNPADALIMALAQRAIWIAIGLTTLAVVARRYEFVQGRDPLSPTERNP